VFRSSMVGGRTLVGTRLATSGTNAYAFQHSTKARHYLASPCSGIRTVHAAAMASEVDSLNPINIKEAIEYSGTVDPLTFGGRTVGTFDAQTVI
jgi:hypothetical protein